MSSTNHSLNPANSDDKPMAKPVYPEPGYLVPQWFLERNVKTPVELSDLHDTISQDELAELRDTTAASFLRDRQGKLYHSEPNILLCAHTMSIGPSSLSNAIVTYLAKDMGAALVSVSLEDMEDLGWEFSGQERQLAGHIGHSLNNGQESDDQKNDNHEKDSQQDFSQPKDCGESKNNKKNNKVVKVDQKELTKHANHYFATKLDAGAPLKEWGRSKRAVSAIIDASKLKSANHQRAGKLADIDGSTAAVSPLIIHVQDFQNIICLPQGFEILSSFSKAIKKKRKSNECIVLLVSMSIAKEQHSLKFETIKEIIDSLFSTIDIDALQYPSYPSTTAKLVAQTNMRRLKIILRLRYEHLFPKDDLSPSSTWGNEWLDENIDTLGETTWTYDELKRAATQIAGRAYSRDHSELEDVQDVLCRMGLYRMTKSGEILVNTNVTGRQDIKWSKLQSRLENICDDYEKMLLPHIINGKAMGVTFDDVIVEEDTKELIQNLVSMSTLTWKKGSKALLDLFRIKGLLLYGPPGTGKTHICRAIANDCGTNMLAVDSAIIHDKYYGESEKYIKAAFTLATKAHPCVLFIDEIDALFYHRSSADDSGQRKMLNQFLKEMDGLTSNDKAPLVVVATNRPGDLDEAFLRRLPQRILFKLPDVETRSKILERFLGDNVDSSVDIIELAYRTRGFSGSDLRSLCAEAVTMWTIEHCKATKELGTGVSLPEMCLSKSHFENALPLIRPSVSKDAINEVTRFARRFRPFL